MNCEGFIPSFQKGVRMNIHLPLPPPPPQKKKKKKKKPFFFFFNFFLLTLK